jgi:hypothetical protein
MFNWAILVVFAPKLSRKTTNVLPDVEAELKLMASGTKCHTLKSCRENAIDVAITYWCVLRREWMGCWGLLG